MATFHERLKRLREQQGLLQKELAAKVGVSRSTVASWENGHRVPELGTTEKLAHLFGVSLDYLLGRTDDPRPPSRADTQDDLDEMPDIVALLRTEQLETTMERILVQGTAENSCSVLLCSSPALLNAFRHQRRGHSSFPL